MQSDYGRDPDEKDKDVKFIGWLTLALLALILITQLSGCKQIEYVTVPEIHEIHHNHTDSVFQRDSVVKETLTTVMQLDSAAMAEYGIQLKNAEKAWMVRTKELERQIQQLKELRNDSIHEVDTVCQPYPVEVIKEVPAELSWWQKTRIYAGNFLLIVLFVAALYGAWKLYKKIYL